MQPFGQFFSFSLSVMTTNSQISWWRALGAYIPAVTISVMSASETR